MDKRLKAALKKGHQLAREYLQVEYHVPEYVFYGWLKAAHLPHWDYVIEDAGGNPIRLQNGENIYLWEVVNDEDERMFDSSEGGVNEWFFLHTMLMLSDQPHIKTLLGEKGMPKGCESREEFSKILQYGVSYMGNAYGNDSFLR